METAEPTPVQRITPWITYVLIAANIVAFVFELVAGADIMKPTPEKMIELGGDFAPLTLHGEPWRLVSSMFLHFGLLHIALNMVCLAQGRVVESLLGRPGFAAVYLVAGLVGGIASMARSTLVVSAGASGAVFGVYGAFGAFLVFRKAAMSDAVWQKTARGIGTFVAINLVYGITTPGIDMSAHIGGLAAGFVAGAALLAGKRADAQRHIRALVVAIAGLAVTAGGVLVLRPPTDVTPVLAEFEKVEAQCIDTFNTLLRENTAGTLTDREMADRVEREVIAPWKAMRAKVTAVENPPARLHALWGANVRYLASRQASWEALVLELRAPQDQREALRADVQAKEAELKTDAEAVKTEIGRLNTELDSTTRSSPR